MSAAAEPRDKVEPRHRVWIAAVNATDIDAYAALVTEDLVWIPPHGEALVGRSAFRAWLRPFFESFAYAFSLADIRARESGGWIAETGRFTSRMTPRSGGGPMAHSGRYLALWRREDDVWRIDRYVDLGDLEAR
jgi:uncharacterized protein (TIGR02246 family)